jgi:hypothetical protein
MRNILYTYAVGSLMYVQVRIKPDLAFVVRMMWRFQSNLKIDYWKVFKKVIRDLQETNNYKLTYKHADHLEVIGYSDLDFVSYIDIRKSTLGYIFVIVRGVVYCRSTKKTMLFHLLWKKNSLHAMKQ